MAKDNMIESHTVQCSCGQPNCALHFKLWRYPEVGDEPGLYIELSVPVVPKIWKRLWLGLRYIFLGHDCAYLGFEHVYSVEGARQHKVLLDRFITEWDKHFKEHK